MEKYAIDRFVELLLPFIPNVRNEFLNAKLAL